MKKILLICNESKTVINFRKELIKFLVKKDFRVSVIVGDSEFQSDIEQLGIKVYVGNYKNRSTNPFSIIKNFSYLRNTIKLDNPDIIFTFQLKPNTLGSLAAKKFKKPVLSMVEGVGDPFQPKNFFGRIIRFVVSKLYKKAFKSVKKVFFLNNDDKTLFIERKIVSDDKTIIIPGIGIDVAEYKPDYNLAKEKRVVCFARLLKNKGIFEYCEVARKVREKQNDIIFELYGSESDYTKEQLASYINDGTIFYGGYSSDPKSVIRSSRLYALTSYREGFSRSVMEAMSLGRPVIGFDVVGVRDAIVDGKTGYLIDNLNIDLFAEKLISLVNDDELTVKMGKEARHYSEQHFDQKIINRKIFDYIVEALNS